MKKQDTPEYTRPAEEFSPAGAEFAPAGREFTLPCTEFADPGREEADAEEFPGGRPTGETPSPRRKRRALPLAAAFVVASVLAFPGLWGGAAAQKPQSSGSVPGLPAASEPAASPAPPAPSAPPAAAEPTPLPQTHPLGSGTLEITVHNSSFDMNSADYNLVLYQAEMAETEFTGLTLPEPVEIQGFVFMGYVLDTRSSEEGQARYCCLAQELTVEDVERVKPNEDGVRPVKVYAAWHAVDSADPWMSLTLDGNGGTPTVAYDASDPLASGGTVFVCAYPVPERAGYRFAGWYREPDGSGTPVDAISALEFFEKDEEGIHWDRPIPTTLYARWLPE